MPSSGAGWSRCAGQHSVFRTASNGNRLPRLRVSRFADTLNYTRLHNPPQRPRPMPTRFLLPIVLFALSAVPRSRGDEPVSFEKQVRPLLKAHCFECHGEGARLKGDLDLRLKRTMVEGGKSGAAILPGKAKGSLLLQRVQSQEMPPSKRKLTASETAILERWIAAGAPIVREE